MSEHKPHSPAKSEGAVSSASAPVHAKLEQAVALHQNGLLAQAQTIYEQILKAHPEHFDVLHLLGVVAYQTNNLQRAVELIGRAIEIFPNNAAFHSNLGNALKGLRKFDAAIESYGRAINIKPDYAEAYNNRGNALQELKQPHAAIADYDRAIVIKPDYAAAYYNRGNALKELGHAEAAVASYNEAIGIHPEFAEAYSNRGLALQQIGQPGAALASYDKAIAIKPDYAEAFNNRGFALHGLKQLDAAIADYDRALAIKPDYAEARCNKSFTLLLAGDFAHGLELYEWRWEQEESRKHKRSFRQPIWLGKAPLTDKTILLHSEQGFGDTIQFCRYVESVAALGARVVLEAQKPLVSLLQNLTGVSQLVAQGDVLPAFDYHCPLLSLPLAFGTSLNTIPSSQRYLSADADRVAKWGAKLGEKTKLRIGLVWSGSIVHKNDHNRSMPLASLIQHLPLQYQYASLQKEVRDTDRKILAARPDILHFGEELGDFADTAALCELMDLVISVDTSIVHLAGALGRAVWVLLPYVPDWRWLLERDDSPWYPAARLYRQQRRGDWEGVLQRVRHDLAVF